MVFGVEPLRCSLSKRHEEICRYDCTSKHRFDIFPAGLPGYPAPAAGSHARVRQVRLSKDLLELRFCSSCRL